MVRLDEEFAEKYDLPRDISLQELKNSFRKNLTLGYIELRKHQGHYLGIDNIFGTNLANSVNFLQTQIINFIPHLRDVPENRDAALAFARFRNELKKFNEDIQKVNHPKIKEELEKKVKGYYNIAKEYIKDQNSLNNKEYPTTLEGLLK